MYFSGGLKIEYVDRRTKIIYVSNTIEFLIETLAWTSQKSNYLHIQKGMCYVYTCIPLSCNA